MKRQLSYEKVPDGTIPGKSKSFAELNEKDQMVLVKTRLKSYSNSVYRKTKVTYHIDYYSYNLLKIMIMMINFIIIIIIIIFIIVIMINLLSLF